jgi:hypothetical protein
MVFKGNGRDSRITTKECKEERIGDEVKDYCDIEPKTQKQKQRFKPGTLHNQKQ